MPPNQNPEQEARDQIDAQLRKSGWAVQDKNAINFNEADGQAVPDYTTDTGPADYVLFLHGQPVGVIEAKKETLGQNITTAEDQTADYAAAKLKWIQNTGDPLPFLYEAKRVVTRLEALGESFDWEHGLYSRSFIQELAVKRGLILE